jgi:stage V sporulation protein D (sporulation-specific penicillin-binding protein)
MYRNGRQGKSQHKHGFSLTRATLILVFFLLCYAALLGRMTMIQIGRHKELRDRALEVQIRSVKTAARRGRILDRNGTVLAANVPGYSVSVRRDAIRDRDRVREVLITLLGLSERRAEAILDWPGAALAAPWVSRDEGDRIKALGLSGVDVAPADRRAYPRGSEATHLLGITDCTGRGREGIEAAYDKELAAKPGSREGFVAALGNRVCFLPGLETKDVEARDGRSLTLTLDSRIQRLVECRLAEGLERCQAKRGIAVMMDPLTGDILAFAYLPAPDPNDRTTLTKEMVRGYGGIWDACEPGSTMKPFTVAAALAGGAARLDTPFNCSGTLAIGKRTIHCHVDDPGTYGHGSVDLRTIVVRSCNVGVAQVAERVGARALYDALRGFGFGESTGSDLPSERSPSIAPPDTWRPIRLANVGFGQGVMATPVQLVAAYSVFANGGVLMEPHCVLRIEDTDGNVVLDRQPRQRRRVLSPEVAQTMREILLGVVEQGTGRQTVRMEGYTAAGKTGTAQKAGPHGYERRYVASFIGFAPYTKPRFTLLVMYDEPKAGHFGAQVAGPVWKAIAEDTLRCMRVLPDRPADVAEASRP